MGSQFVDFCYKFTGFGLFFDNYGRCICVNDKNNNNNKNGLTLSLPECLMEFCKVALTFESVDEILWCGHSNESSLPVLTHGAICFTKFYKMKFKNLVEICLCLHLAVKGLIDSFWMNSASKQPTFRDATAGFHAKWRLRSERRNSAPLANVSDCMKLIFNTLGASFKKTLGGSFFFPIKVMTILTVFNNYSAV